MTEDQRVVITGIGTVNSIASDAPGFAEALKAGRSGIKNLTVFDPQGHMTGMAAEIRGFSLRDRLGSEVGLKRMSRADGFGLAAAAEALKDAGLCPVPPDLALEFGVSVGGGAGGLLRGEDFYQKYLTDPEKAPYSWLSAVYGSSTADRIAQMYDLGGPKTTIMTACSSGGTAIGWARDWIRAGLAQVVLAGGTEPICRLTYTAFNALRAVDPEYTKPFSRNRRGLTLGEGAGFLVLEPLSRAQNRSARIYAEVLGYGLSADAHHMTAPHPDGLGAALAMRSALADAKIEPQSVDYINAHGTGTPANDAAETKAVKAVFGPEAYRIPISSTKSMIGHTLAAAGAIEAVTSVLALDQGFIPPTINREEPDPDCDLDYVVEGARSAGLKVVMSNSFAFGGNNTVLVLGRPPKEAAHD